MANSVIKASTSNMIMSQATTLSGLSGSGELDVSVTLTPGVWALMMNVQGESTAITSNGERAEFNFSIQPNIGSSLPHNTPYPKTNACQVVRVTTDTVCKIAYYIDTSELDLNKVILYAQKIG